jgi:hypothetical protein
MMPVMSRATANDFYKGKRMLERAENSCFAGRE